MKTIYVKDTKPGNRQFRRAVVASNINKLFKLKAIKNAEELVNANSRQKHLATRIANAKKRKLEPRF